MANEIIIRFPFKDRTEERKLKVKLTPDDIIKFKDAVGMSLKIRLRHSTGIEKEFTLAIERFLQLEGNVMAIVSEKSVKEIEHFFDKF